MKTGDVVAVIANPIAYGIDHVFGTNLSNCLGCKQSIQKLNDGVPIWDVFYDRFFPKVNPKEQTNATNNN